MAVIVVPLFVTSTPLLPNILKSALPDVSDAAEPPPLSVVIVTPVISPVETSCLYNLPSASIPTTWSCADSVTLSN